jgi:hypothetical protein
MRITLCQYNSNISFMYIDFCYCISVIFVIMTLFGFLLLLLLSMFVLVLGLIRLSNHNIIWYYLSNKQIEVVIYSSFFSTWPINISHNKLIVTDIYFSFCLKTMTFNNNNLLYASILSPIHLLV